MRTQVKTSNALSGSAVEGRKVYISGAAGLTAQTREQAAAAALAASLLLVPRTLLQSKNNNLRQRCRGRPS